MVLRISLVLCAAVLAGAVAAQPVAPGRAAPNDRWDAAPAAASSSTYRAGRALPGGADDRHSPFHFKEPARRGPAYKPPPEANDKAAVMGKQRPWQNGRPPVDCAVTPRDPACQ